MNIPIAGFAAAAGLNPAVELVPLFWCAAEPAAHVTDDAFERISKMLIDGLRAAGAIDGLYLDLHGAMVTESYEDGEGELLRRVRGFLGDDLPISVSLDLHANVTPAMVHRATSLTIFRTYPHLDMADTGARNLALLLSHIAGTKPKKAFRQVPYLIPLSAQYTGVEPCRSLYAAARRFSARPGCSADIALGFSAADIADAGPAIVAFAQDQETADSIADELLMAFLAAEEVFDCHLYSPAEAVRQALDMRAGRPVVIADVQDNPGAGGTSDSTGMLSALIEEGAQGALIGLLHDAEIAAKAHAAGIGARIEGALGGKSGWPGQVPYNGHFRVAALGDGNCRYTGQMYGGSIAVLGPTAVLTIEDVRADVHVVVTSNRSQCLDLALFTHLGLNPKDARIICVKSTVHFRADFEPIAAAVLSAAAPGLFPCLLPQVPYSRLRDGLRLGPKGPAFKGR